MAVQLKAMRPIGDNTEASADDGYQGDRQWNQRAEGARDASVNGRPTEGAIMNRPLNNSDAHADSDRVEFEDLEREPNRYMDGLRRLGEDTHAFYQAHYNVIWVLIWLIVAALYFAYLGYAMYCSFGDKASIRLLWVTCVVMGVMALNFLWRMLAERITVRLEPCLARMRSRCDLLTWILLGLIYAAVVLFVIFDVAMVSKNPYNLVSGCGIVFYVVIFYVFSYSPSMVRWRPVLWGLALQFIFALLILRWSAGNSAFVWLGARVTEFLLHADAGSIFLFGKDDYMRHYMAFKILPVIVFFSTFISVLYYLGAMQSVIKVTARVMQFTMGTTAGESVTAAGNIFVGQTEAPLMIRPLLKDMTRSEIHAVLTGGFATIAGTVLAAYVGLGVPANHLLSASVMSAPAALAMSKLIYPETQKSRTKAGDIIRMEKSHDINLIAAASSGASASISMVASIAVHLIAFLSILAFLNATLTWLGQRVGLEELTFQYLCSYLLWPLALAMGVSIPDCRQVARLVGLKAFFNEFVAYIDLGTLISNRAAFERHLSANGTYYMRIDDLVLMSGSVETVLEGGIMTERSEVISTYALCGFSNVSAMGIMLGALGAMAPNRKSDLAKVVVSAMIAGNVACFMTACIAGLLYNGE